MKLTMSLAQFAKESDGVLNRDVQFNRVCTDTRQLQKGDLFIAISGENFDGNQFVKQAVDSGAVGVVTNSKPTLDIPYLLVEDPRWVYGLIARNNRREFNGPVIGLTGSAGKTTCKEMLAAILGECGNVLATQGNFNNEVGVPATLLNLSSEHDSAVIEMGASRAGDIQYLCQFSEPTISIVTNAMAAHIEGFGDVQTIASTKGEIFEGDKAESVAVINLDDTFASQWKEQASNKKIVTFSQFDHSADVFGKNIQINSMGHLKFDLCTADGEESIELPLLGRHNINNALAASAAAISAGANLQQVKNGLKKVSSVRGRLMPMPTDRGQIVIDDSYNANPGSVKAAIDVLVDISKSSTQGVRSTCLVLGSMAELGEESAQYHREVANYARERGIHRMIAVGEYASVMEQSYAGKGEAFNHIDELLLDLDKHIQEDIVLVKGSRSAHMEQVVDGLVSGTGIINNKLGKH